MKRPIVLALIFASTMAATPPGPSGSQSSGMPPSVPGPPPMSTAAPGGAAPSTPDSAAMLARAKLAFAQLQGGSVDRTSLDADMNAALTDDKLAAVKSAIGNLGTPASFAEVKNGSSGAYHYVVYLVTFAGGAKMDFVFAVDTQGKIAGMQLTPPQ